MTLDFDFDQVKIIEFGVGLDNGEQQSFWYVPVDDAVQTVLRDMAMETWHAMQEDFGSDPLRYEPSERYASQEYVYLPLADDLAKQMRQLYEANNLPTNSGAISNPAAIYCYFVHMTDQRGRRVTALRRATQFKGVLRSRLIRFVTDALQLIEDRVFKLDSNFDLLIDSQQVHILRPSGFEFAGMLQEAVVAAVPQIVKALQHALPFVDFASIQDYASKHPRAARYLASIRSQQNVKNVDKRALKRLCTATGVQTRDSKGKISVEDSQVVGFLEVLDRRRYEVELVKDSPERFKAASRRRLDEVK